jgi:excisionase family DNA binding protein
MSKNPDNQGLLAEGFIKVMEAAAFLKVSRAKIYQMMDDGELIYAKFGKSRRLPLRGLREYAEKALVGC